MPQADAVAVIAPGIVAMALRRRGTRRVAAEPGAEGEMLDVVVEGNGEPLAPGPLIWRPLVDRDIVVAAVRREFHGCNSEPHDAPHPNPLPASAGRGNFRVLPLPRPRGESWGERLRFFCDQVEGLPSRKRRLALFHEGGAAFGVIRAGEAFVDQTLAQCEVARRLVL